MSALELCWGDIFRSKLVKQAVPWTIASVAYSSFSSAFVSRCTAIFCNARLRISEYDLTRESLRRTDSRI
jgi:hypothetical protein